MNDEMWDLLVELYEGDPVPTEEQILAWMDSWDTRQLLGVLAQLMSTNKPVPEPLRIWVAHIAMAGSQGESLDKILQHKRGKGEKPNDTTRFMRDWGIVAAVEFEHLTSSTSLREASAEVADRVGMDADTVRRIHREKRSLVKGYTAQELESWGTK